MFQENWKIFSKLSYKIWESDKHPKMIKVFTFVYN